MRKLEKSTRLCFGETELWRELDSFGRRQVLLDVEALLEAVELRVAEHRSSLAATAVLRQVVDRRPDDAARSARTADVVQQTMQLESCRRSYSFIYLNKATGPI